MSNNQLNKKLYNVQYPLINLISKCLIKFESITYSMNLENNALYLPRLKEC